MGEVLVTSVVALIAAVLVAVWTVGGRGALQRRTIKQELEIAASLPDGPERRRLESLALELTTLYVHRRGFRQHSPRALRRLGALTLGACVLLGVLLAVWGPATRGGWDLLVTLMIEATAVLLGGLLGYWITYGVRFTLASHREDGLAEARAALDREREGDVG